jgi:phenylalanyl-tRNA synthetase beta chain
MRVPIAWLKEFVDLPAEPRRLAEDLTFAGLAVDGVEGQGDGAVLDLDITTNRVDCMNVYGVAREAALIYDRPLRPPDLAFPESGAPAAEAWRVEIAAPDLCGRFAGRVLDVRLGASPAWMRERLEQVGLRPINNVVDLTNYVMMEVGHPSHAFDLDKLAEGRVVVRWAREGEKLTTLDGQERTLRASMGVVAGVRDALALAGVMGGASSEVSDSTRRVALEAAWWEPLPTRRTAKALGLHTEASHRFERGADFEGPPLATARIAHLLVKIGAGSVRPGLIDVVAAPRARRTVALRPARANALLGADVPAARALSILRGLGFGLGEPQGPSVDVTLPSWRNDVAREVDLVEEIGRHFGLDRIPSSVPPSTAPGGLTRVQARERLVRQTLAAAGLVEAINLAFVDDTQSLPQPPRIALANPLAEPQGVLRTSLVVPGLLANLRTNLRQGRRDVRLFEIGRVFLAGDGFPREELRLGILLAGASRSHWSERERAPEFFDVAGLVRAVFERLGLEAPRLDRAELPAHLHPGRAARVSHAGTPLGWLGALAPAVAKAWELRDETFAAELALDALLAARPPAVRMQPIERFPAVVRDLAIVCKAGVEAREIEGLVRAAGGELLRSVAILDRYEGPQVPAGHYSLALGLRYQHGARTLSGEEVQASVERIVAALRVAGAEIRGE